MDVEGMKVEVFEGNRRPDFREDRWRAERLRRPERTKGWERPSMGISIRHTERLRLLDSIL